MQKDSKFLEIDYICDILKALRVQLKKMSRLYEFWMKIKEGRKYQKLRNKTNPGRRIRIRFYPHLIPVISSAFLDLTLSFFSDPYS